MRAKDRRNVRKSGWTPDTAGGDRPRQPELRGGKSNPGLELERAAMAGPSLAKLRTGAEAPVAERAKGRSGGPRQSIPAAKAEEPGQEYDCRDVEMPGRNAAATEAKASSLAAL